MRSPSRSTAPIRAGRSNRGCCSLLPARRAGADGSHWGCDTSNCGACVVWLDETPVKCCTVLAVMADGRRVTTVEGLAAGHALDPVQEAFAACHGLQCGFCTPGMMMTARWLLDHNRIRRQRRSGRRYPARSAAAPGTRTSSGRCCGQRSTTSPASTTVPSNTCGRRRAAGHETGGHEAAVMGPLTAAPPQGGRAFIRGQGKFVDDMRCPACCTAHPAQPARARPDRLGRCQCRPRPPDGRGVSRRRPGRTGHGVDAHALRRRAGGARHRQGGASRARSRVRGGDPTGTRRGTRLS